MYFVPSDTYSFTVIDHLQKDELNNFDVIVNFVNSCYDQYIDGSYLDGFTPHSFDVTNLSFLGYYEDSNTIVTIIRLGKTADILVEPILPDCPISSISFSLPDLATTFINDEGDIYLNLDGQLTGLDLGAYQG